MNYPSSVEALSVGDQLVAAYAGLPTAGVSNGARAFVTDGRKSGEGAGLGTGIPAYFNEADNSWRNYFDDGVCQT